MQNGCDWETAACYPLLSLQLVIQICCDIPYECNRCSNSASSSNRCTPAVVVVVDETTWCIIQSTHTIIWVVQISDLKSGLIWHYPPNQPLHLTNLLSITRPWVITGNESEQSKSIFSLSLSFSLFDAFYLALGSNVYAFTEIAGGIVREKWGFIFFLFSLSFFHVQSLAFRNH